MSQVLAWSAFGRHWPNPAHVNRPHRVPKDAFRAIPLQVHGVLAGVPLHDVTVTDLAGGGPGRTVADVRAWLTARSGSKAGPATRALFAFRKALGKLFGWDELPEALAKAFVCVARPARDRAALVGRARSDRAEMLVLSHLGSR
jgi:hypothetical protein